MIIYIILSVICLDAYQRQNGDESTSLSCLYRRLSQKLRGLYCKYFFLCIFLFSFSLSLPLLTFQHSSLFLPTYF